MSPRKNTPEHVAQLRDRLISDARQIVRQHGAAALTMRALAAEAGCAVGLAYNVFTDRAALVEAMVESELPALVSAGEALRRSAGHGRIADNLVTFADVFLHSPAVALADEVMADPAARERIAASATASGLAPQSFPDVVAQYLAAEQAVGRIRPAVDTSAFGYLLASTLHNLLAAGPAWPRPDAAELHAVLAAVAEAISPS